MQVNWSDEAYTDLDDITDYIAENNIAAAVKLSKSLFTTAEKLGQMPYMGGIGRVQGTREFVAHPNYILIYRVGLDSLRILRVLHARRNYP